MPVGPQVPASGCASVQSPWVCLAHPNAGLNGREGSASWIEAVGIRVGQRKGDRDAVRLSSQLPGRASAVRGHVVCAVGVLIFHDFFLFRCPPALEPYCCLRALFGHQGDLVDVGSS